MRQVSERALKDEVVGLARDLLRVDTSNPPGGETPAALVLRDYLTAAGITVELVARRPERANLIARLSGSGGGPSLALMGHTDVVPVGDPAGWTRGPFSGDIDDDGYLWGRGALDMKNEVASRAVALAVLARSGFRPKGDIVFIAQADEEDGTEQVGLAWLRHERPDLACDYALDEGGGRRMQLADGRVVVTLDVGSKATLPVLLTALGRGGHASVPPDDSAVLRLAILIDRLGRYRPGAVLTPENRRMLELLVGPLNGELDPALARARALHPWLGGTLDARLRTTIAPTRLWGAPARNVVPSRASVECDCRVLPGWTQALLTEQMQEALGDDIPYELEFLEPPTGGTSSPTDTPLYGICQQFLDHHDPGTVLLPTIGTGFTDSHFMRESFGTVAYGICPLRHSDESVHKTEHAENERIHVDDLLYGTQFHLYVTEHLTGAV